jgi:hypothetical protein
LEEVEIRTVDGFQGREKELIILRLENVIIYHNFLLIRIRIILGSRIRIRISVMSWSGFSSKPKEGSGSASKSKFRSCGWGLKIEHFRAVDAHNELVEAQNGGVGVCIPDTVFTRCASL